MSNKILTAERVRHLLDYDPATGAFTWRERRGGTANKGSRAGCIDAAGYWQIYVDLKNYRGHVLAWLHTYGEWPLLIDHKDGNKANNKITNLRLSDKSLNGQNLKGPNRGNSSGYLGVSRCKSGWLAQMKLNGRHVLSRVFPTPELAHEAYIKAKRLLHKGCTL